MGYTREEILGKHFSMFYTIEDRAAGRPLADLTVARTEGHTEMEGWMIKKTGDLFWANANITSVRSNFGQLLGFSVITRDCTEKKKNLDMLHATEEKYHLLISSVTDYTIIMLDRAGIITTWNAGAQKVNGYHAEEVIGRHFSLFYDAAALAEGKPERDLKLASMEGRFEEEGCRVKKGGMKFYANVVLSAIYNARREIVGFSKVTRDITDRMKAQVCVSSSAPSLLFYSPFNQAALRASEERFQLLISSVKDYSIIMLDINGYVTTWNSGKSPPMSQIGLYFTDFI
jgi:PAS domain S-box-containing protein